MCRLLCWIKIRICLSMQRSYSNLHEHRWRIHMWCRYSLWWSSFPCFCSRLVPFKGSRDLKPYSGQDPVCFDVNSKSGSVLDLFSDNTSSLEINALFKVFSHRCTLVQLWKTQNRSISAKKSIIYFVKNVHGDKKQFIKAIGFTSPQGIQIAITPFNVEVYEDGNLKHIYEIDQQGEL